MRTVYQMIPTCSSAHVKSRGNTNLMDSFVLNRTTDAKTTASEAPFMNERDRQIPTLVDPDAVNSSGEESEYERYWLDWFLTLKGNEYFCEIEEDYILDRFNLTGLNTEVVHYAYALDLITDYLNEELDDSTREEVEKSARHLYGLIHARYIITHKGLGKMVAKFENGDFGRCPRVMCKSNGAQPLLPVGLSDLPGQKGVKLYCPKCEDIYNPKSARHSHLDGAYFGTSFPHMLLQMYPHLTPQKSHMDRYVPKIFGFRIRDVSVMHSMQDRTRDQMNQRVAEVMNVEGGGKANPGRRRKDASEGERNSKKSSTAGKAVVDNTLSMLD